MSTTYGTHWQETDAGLVATFATGTMVDGLEFVTRIVAAAEEANHHPDIVLTYPRVALTSITHDAGNTVTDKDRALAADIDVIAAELGISGPGVSI